VSHLNGTALHSTASKQRSNLVQVDAPPEQIQSP